MARRPVIVYVESPYAVAGENPDRSALTYFLGEECGYELLLYDGGYELRQDLERLRLLLASNLVLLFVVAQESYSDEHSEIIGLVRSELAETIPIVVLQGGWEERFKENPKDPSVRSLPHTSPELIQFINSLAATWQPKLPDWLGAETKADQEILSGQLENAYRIHCARQDENNLLGTPDANHMVVAEALRIKLLPSLFLKEEFDDTIPESRNEFAQVGDATYLEEEQKLRSMNDSERRAFEIQLLRVQGVTPHPDGGFYRLRASCGENVNGFAIDPITLQTLTTYRFAEHQSAGDFLSMRIERIEAMRTDDNEFVFERIHRVRSRLMTGLIFSNAPGFKTPIFQGSIYCRTEEERESLRRIVQFLRQQQRMLLVDSQGKLVESQ